MSNYLKNKKLTEQEKLDYILACFKEVHGDRYSYENTTYPKDREKMAVTCKVHGDFFVTSTQHRKGVGCKYCFYQTVSDRHFSNEWFVTKAIETHGTAYSYDRTDYKNCGTKVTITCPIHGDFETLPYNHINGAKCKRCAAHESNAPFVKPQDVFINEVREVHGDLYDLSLVKYTGNKQWVDVICKKHGLFKIHARYLAQGKGCQTCKKEERAKITKEEGFRWTRSKWVEFCHQHNRKPFFYTIHAYGNGEDFYKIGITSLSISERFKGFPYQYEVVTLVQDEPLIIYEIELLMKRLVKSNQYIPKIKFSGYTECLKGDNVKHTPLSIEDFDTHHSIFTSNISNYQQLNN